MARDCVTHHHACDCREARFRELESERDALKRELDLAERALHQHGYRKSCAIPACNCGDQWNHGGHAAERLREIADEVYVNGQTALQSVRALKRECEALKADKAEMLGALQSVVATDSNGFRYASLSATLRLRIEGLIAKVRSAALSPAEPKEPTR